MTVETKLPKVSIGLPVYNGERYLRRVIDCHLAQTFRDFELIISDNASTDGTRALCEEFAEQDDRVRYHRVPENKGAMWNFNHVFHLSRGEYFKWSAHDDLIDPGYLEKCVAVLDARPDVVLCHSLSKVVDLAPLDREHLTPEKLPVLATYDPGALATGADRATTRFGARMNARRCIEIFALMRSRAIAKVNRAGKPPLPADQDPSAVAPYQSFVGADRPVLAEIAVEGKFACVPEYLFYNGEHTGRSTALGKDPLKRLEFYRPVKQGTRSFPIWSLFGAYLDITQRRFPAWSDRLRCYRHMFTALFTRFNILRMMFEPVNALAPGLAPSITRGVTALRRQLGLTGYRTVRSSSSSPLKIK